MARKPSDIDERPQQIRPPIIKAEGSTRSERYLAKLADKSFLNLWSYPSPYRDQKQGGTGDKQKQSKAGDGKELCDLLVVCGEHVIIFSEKTIDWPSGDILTAWRRWARRAIRDSAKQTRGAERWIAEFPDRIFLDRDCSVPFPIDLPSKEVRQVHRVVVANGSAKACQVYAPGSSGSLIIRPSVVGDSHWTDRNSEVKPFSVGDIDPDGSFIHVFNEAALDIVMAELDTVRDFTDYLAKKQAFVRSGKLSEAQGEENLLAFYAIRVNSEGDHDFVVKDGKAPISIDRNQYARLIDDPQYLAKKNADKVSYLWDRLIEAFTNHMLGGTSVTLEGFDFDLRKNELSVRHMALVQRFVRRSHSEAIAGALVRGKASDRFTRVMMSPPWSKDNETAFFIQTVKYLDRMEAEGGYQEYRRYRTGLAMIYAKGLLELHPHLKRVVGISREPPDQGRGVSEDLLYAEQHEWTEQEREKIRKECEAAGVLQDLKEHRFRGEEFPEVETIEFDCPAPQSPNRQLNRKQRRALKAQLRKRKRS